MAALKLEIAFDDEFQNKMKNAMQEFLDEKMTEIEKTIRAECADRAVAWCKKWAEFPTGNHGTGALRAAIEGGQDGYQTRYNVEKIFEEWVKTHGDQP
jgi:hypothetical protein